MNTITQPLYKDKIVAQKRALQDPNWVKWSLIAIAVSFISLFICIPLGLVIFQAFLMFLLILELFGGYYC